MITQKDIRYFNHAYEASKLSDFDRVHIGCIAVYKNRILSLGYNMNKSHPMQKKYNQYRQIDTSGGKCPKESLHAESYCLLQIKDLDIDFSKIKLYIYRIRKDIGRGISRPCPACMRAIKDMGIKNIYYTTNDGYVYENILYN